MDISVVLVAAGRGERLGGTDKAFIKIRGKELVLYSLKTFLSFEQIKEVIVVLNEENIEKAKNIVKNNKVHFVLGGKTRAESVRNGIMKSQYSFIMVHDAARPFITKDLLERIVGALSDAGAVIPVLNIKPTIKETENGIVKKTLNREKLVSVQTPQLFKKNLLLKSYNRFTLDGVTDEAMLIEKMGEQVRVVKGIEENIKITTPFDLIVLEGIIKKWNGK